MAFDRKLVLEGKIPRCRDRRLSGSTSGSASFKPKYDEMKVSSEENIDESTDLKKIYDPIKQKTKIDFSGYKQTTLRRRVQRRMKAVHENSLKSYFPHMKNTMKSPSPFTMAC